MCGRLIPEGHRMICIWHGLLSVGQLRAGSRPVEVNDDIHSVIDNTLYEISDWIDIVLPAILRLDPVYTQPALFI